MDILRSMCQPFFSLLRIAGKSGLWGYGKGLGWRWTISLNLVSSLLLTAHLYLLHLSSVQLVGCKKKLGIQFLDVRPVVMWWEAPGQSWESTGEAGSSGSYRGSITLADWPTYGMSANNLAVCSILRILGALSPLLQLSISQSSCWCLGLPVTWGSFPRFGQESFSSPFYSVVLRSKAV